ncbi:hypothetical protein GQ53DRAFT_826682 [Thozetella sp. PMI_491]|nr:hypothetical protein GQ53DRAFT_826682 [Thozetella sp. PMI_491]
MISRQAICSAVSPVFLAASVGFFLAGKNVKPSDLDCVKSMSSWSPALDVLDHKWETFQNGFGDKSIYRGLPNEMLEGAWNASLPEHPFVVPKADVVNLGIQTSDDFVTDGHGGVLAQLEVFRNLGCLNLLRQHTYRTAYDYSHLAAFSGPEEQIMARVDGCVQRLREMLMCAGDATPYLVMLTPERKQKESPDFNTLHYCRNYDVLLGWAQQNGVSSGVALPSLYQLTDE